MNHRENTFRINYATLPKKPSYDKILDFCSDELGLSESEVLTVQCSRNLGCAFVETSTVEIAQRVCEQYDGKHIVTIDGKNYPLRITLEDGAVEVKLTDLSKNITSDKITEFLRQFGDVISIREERYSHPKFSNISTGVRLVRMVVKKNIESIVTIDGETTMLSYFGQRQTCRHCHEFMHVGASCAENRKLLVQKSYADALKKQTKQNPKLTASADPQVKRKSLLVDVATTKKHEPKRTNNGVGKSLMPPPATPDIVSKDHFPSLPTVEQTAEIPEAGSMTTTAGQAPDVASKTMRKNPSVADGNETDDSVASSGSGLRVRLPRSKKRRDGSDNEQGEKEKQ